AAEKYFVNNAQILKRLEVTENALRDNAKIIVPTGSSLSNVIGDLSGIVPIPDHRVKKEESKRERGKRRDAHRDIMHELTSIEED
ncbi:MAG: hypothetical protein KKD39_08060, partial [Candidatus Altiarchaeota archaeon]|nr:hypothetical protein [Candidatus Altiarchaeota archaeon]